MYKTISARLSQINTQEPDQGSIKAGREGGKTIAMDV